MVTTIGRDLTQFQSYRYPVTAYIIPQGGSEADEIDLSASITGVRIIEDYDENTYPYYGVSMLMSVNDYRQLQASWRTGSFFVTIGKNTLPIGGGTNDESPTGDPYRSNVELQILTAPSTPDGINSDQISDQALTTPRIGVTIEAIPTSSLAANKALNNTVYHGQTPTDMVAHLISQSAPPGYKFTMAPADNMASVESSLMPPLSLTNAIRHIDEVHGLYTGNLHIFLSHDQGYILSSTKTIAPAAGDPTRVVLEAVPLSNSGPESVVGSGYDPTSLTIRLRTGQPLDLDMRGPVHQEAEGEVLKLVNSSQGAPFSSDIQDITASGQTLASTPKQRVVWQGYDSPMQASKIAASTRELYAPTNVVFSDVDLDAFRIELPWTLQVADPAQNPIEGDWRLSAVEIILSRAPGSQGSCSASVMAKIRPSSSGSIPS